MSGLMWKVRLVVYEGISSLIHYNLAYVPNGWDMFIEDLFEKVSMLNSYSYFPLNVERYCMRLGGRYGPISYCARAVCDRIYCKVSPLFEDDIGSCIHKLQGWITVPQVAHRCGRAGSS